MRNIIRVPITKQAVWDARPWQTKDCPIYHGLIKKHPDAAIQVLENTVEIDGDVYDMPEDIAGNTHSHRWWLSWWASGERAITLTAQIGDQP